MKSKRRLLFCIGTVILLIVVAAVMMVIGRGHTLYFDNVTLENYEGQTYEPPYKAEIVVKGEKVANLHEKERGMATWIGQNFKMLITITAEKGGDEKTYAVNLKLPYNMDGIIVNIPAVMAGLPQEAWCSEFIQTIVEEEEEPADDGLGGDLGGDLGGEDLGGDDLGM